MSGDRKNTRAKLTIGVVGLMLGASLVGCQSATAPSSDFAGSSKVSHSLHVGQWIGSDGGFLSMGEYSLEIPANALSETTFIEMEQVGVGEWPVELSPHGIQFNLPVSLSMNAASTMGADDMKIHWWNPDAGHWDEQQSMVDNGVVSAQLQHFSRYTLK